MRAQAFVGGKELRFGVPNPDFGLAGVSGVVSGQQLATPRQFRVGLRYEF